jgi:transaldolase|tara:strand:+ start:424 stop:1113 length:690 start_codon:yes stop_codon:yes gene_type:complete
MQQQEVQMKIFLDCSDPDLIAYAVETGLVDGVTTNPSLMRKAGQNPRDVIERICDLFPWDASISAEVVGDTAEEMLEMATDYYQIAPNITIKLPCNREGLIACGDLSGDGIPTNVTLIFSAAQAILAAKAGATYVSPFVGRVYDQYWDGMDLIKQIDEIYDKHEVETEILAASIRNPIEVPTAFRMGADVVTMPIDIFSKLYDHVLTKQGLDKFNEDWSQLMMEIHSDE